jgi:hypothetical protein
VQPPPIREVLGRVTELAGDGYVPGEQVIQSWRLPRREAVRALRRAIGGGYLLERRGPDRRTYVALASEGWALLEAGEGAAEPRAHGP